MKAPHVHETIDNVIGGIERHFFIFILLPSPQPLHVHRLQKMNGRAMILMRMGDGHMMNIGRAVSRLLNARADQFAAVQE